MRNSLSEPGRALSEPGRGQGRRWISGLLPALAVALLSSACATPTAPPPDVALGAQAAPAPEYRIGVNDLLRISVWRQPELTLDSVTVRPDGRISVPLLDDVPVSGKTPEELKGEI